MSQGCAAPTRPVLRYFGGKWRLAPWIVSHFPRHHVYVEPFGGAASVLLRKPRAYAEVYNDVDGDVVNLFRVLRDPDHAAALMRDLELTPFARDEFEIAYEPGEGPVEQARKMVVRSHMGFGNVGATTQHRTGFRANSSRSGTTPATDWSRFPKCLPPIVERLRGVVIENRDAAAVMLAHDSPKTLHYLDPPYVHSTRYCSSKDGPCNDYRNELDDDAHVALARVAREMSGMVILSGYACELYNQLWSGWRRVDTPAMADGARPRLESLWMNPAAVAAFEAQQPQLDWVGVL